MNTFEKDKQYIANTYARAEVNLVRGKGATAYDEDGKKYIDLGAGIAVNTFGYSDDIWCYAVTEQLRKIQHTSNLYYTQPQADLAEMLCKRTGAEKVFFSNSGAEANECAIKLARKYAHDKYGDSRSKILTLKNSFHGRTVTTLSATGQDVFHKNFAPFTGGFDYITANDMSSVDALDGSVAAVMIEIIQGEGGVLVLEPNFVNALYKKAKDNDILFIVDEVQTGNGRCGSLYAYENYEILPDIVSTAKGLAGGLPLGATLIFEKCKDTFAPSDHGSTFGGNPVCCAGALSILSRIDDALLRDVQRKGKYIFDSFENADGVISVCGMGLMIGIETRGNAAEIVNAARQAGVLVLTAKKKLRLVPPLCITDGELSEAVEILKKVIAEYGKELNR